MKNESFSAMILAAGYGKRLKPLTDNTPKPLIEVKGKPLLQNTIEFLLNIDCKEIVINTHYRHELIEDFIKKNFGNKNIIISYEKEILDTGGGIKKAADLFNNKKILVTNSDVFWTNKNSDHIIKFINNVHSFENCKLLLVPENYVNGLYNISGDFYLDSGKVFRWKKNKTKFFYSGLQILELNLLNNYLEDKFSINLLWDKLISKNQLYGDKLESNWYHVGDIKALNDMKNLIT
tara:strand:+ start:561 stop:1265 length:705 start_codon:yes stop_codon:yes gene_type:complete